jgi:Cof subfamily protein (haloacid dehalogenase superfamily)
MQTYESDANIGNIKLIAVDMDKTLLTDERVLPQGLDERLDKLADAGIVFCPASGRPAPKLEEMFEGIKNRLAFCPDNGACVIYHGNYIYKSNIDVELYQQVLSRASEDPRAVPVLCCYDEFYVLARDHQYHDEISVYYNTINYVDSFEGIDIESNKISIFFPAYDAEPAFRETYSPEFSDKLYVTNAGREWIDFMNLGVDKGAGVAHLCEHLGIDIADAAAVGDTYNDIPMLERVGHSFIVDNAEEHMNAHAKWRIPSNNDGGVLTLIDAILAAR